MKIISKDKDGVTIKLDKDESEIICYVSSFIQGGVNSNIENTMLKIAGMLEAINE